MALVTAAPATAHAQTYPYDGGPVPAGYHVESHPPTGKLIGGIVLGALGTTLLVATLSAPSEQPTTGCDARCAGTGEGISDTMRGGLIVVTGADPSPTPDPAPNRNPDRLSLSFGAAPMRDGGVVALVGAF